MGNKALDCTALTVSLIGAINWGLVGFFNFNLVSWIFGNTSWITRVIYALVGLCGLSGRMLADWLRTAIIPGRGIVIYPYRV